MMTSERKTLVALVWRRMPADLKVATNGMKLVSFGGTMVSVESLSDADLFAVLRRVNVVKTVTKALESMEAA